jgi:hypothetical protein
VWFSTLHQKHLTIEPPFSRWSINIQAHQHPVTNSSTCLPSVVPLLNSLPALALRQRVLCLLFPNKRYWGPFNEFDDLAPSSGSSTAFNSRRANDYYNTPTRDAHELGGCSLWHGYHDFNSVLALIHFLGRYALYSTNPTHTLDQFPTILIHGEPPTFSAWFCNNHGCGDLALFLYYFFLETCAGALFPILPRLFDINRDVRITLNFIGLRG